MLLHQSQLLTAPSPTAHGMALPPRATGPSASTAASAQVGSSPAPCSTGQPPLSGLWTSGGPTGTAWHCQPQDPLRREAALALCAGIPSTRLSAPVRRVFHNQPTCKSFQPNSGKGLSGQWRPQLPKPLPHTCASFNRAGQPPWACSCCSLARPKAKLSAPLSPVTSGPDLNVLTAQNRRHTRQRRGNGVSKDGSPGLTVHRDIGPCCPGRWGRPTPGPPRPGPLPPDTESTVEGTVPWVLIQQSGRAVRGELGPWKASL